MNICLISQSNQIKDFIYLIQKILKKGKGIDQVSERLYKPITKSNYQKKQLKRPSNVFPSKQKQNKTPIIQEHVELEILQSVKTIQSEEVEYVEHKSIKVIPKTFLQTMAYNLREQGLVNKMRNTLQDQIIFLQDCEIFYKNMEKKKEIIQLSQQDLKATDKTQKLKAWSYHRAMQQMQILEKELDNFMVPLGKDKGIMIQEKVSLQQHKKNLQDNLDQLQAYTSLNFFDNENIQLIIDFLILYHDAFMNCEKTKPILLYEGSLWDALEDVRNNASKIIAEIKKDYQEFATLFQQNEEQNYILNEILNIRLLHIALYFILERAEYQPQHHKELLLYDEKINKFSIQINSNNSLKKLFKLRKKQIKILEMVINFINSNYPYNRSLLIEMFFVKEIYFLEVNLTNFDHLKYLNDNIKLLQDTLILRGKFVSSINLQILDLSKLNSLEKVSQKKAVKPQTQKSVKKVSANEKQINYIKQIEENNKTGNLLKNKLKSSSNGLIKSEMENKLDKLKAQLLSENIAKKHEEKQQNFLILKYRNQQNTNIIETEITEKRHQDIAGQLMYLVSDARFQFYNQSQIYSQITNIYNQHFYKSGFPKSLTKKFDEKQVLEIKTLYENIKILTHEFQLQLNHYFQDKTYKQYAEIKQNKDFILEAQNIDFINFSLLLSSRLLSLIQYHSTTYSIENYLNFFMPANPDNTPNSIKEYLLHSQKISGKLYDVLQKNSDAQLICEWNSSLKNKIRCTQSQQDKLFEMISRINHCFILQFEVIRHIYQELVVEIFHNSTFSFNPQQVAQNYIEKSLQHQLQNKMRYFPNLASQIMQALEIFFAYLQKEIMSNLSLYYQISIFDNVNLNNLEKVLAYHNSDMSSLKIKTLQDIVTLQSYQNQQITEMMEKQIFDEQNVSARQSLTNLLNENLKKPKQPKNSYIEIIIQTQKEENQFFYLQLANPNFKQVLQFNQSDSESNFINLVNQKNLLTITINNQFVQPRLLVLTTNKPPKYYNLIINGSSRTFYQFKDAPSSVHSFLLLKYQFITQKEMTNQYIYF